MSGEPLQYLLGKWEFYGYPFKVGKGVLIPRPETEMLVDYALEFCQSHSNSIVLDLCSGSGCVGISIAKKAGVSVVAVEKSQAALSYLYQNVDLNNISDKVKVLEGDVLDSSLPAQLVPATAASLILINPPYLSEAEMLELQEEVTYEPASALLGGGSDGLDFYRRFFTVWKDALNLEYVGFACEVGDGQANAVCALLHELGIAAEVLQDFSGIDRVIVKTVIERHKTT